MMGADSQLETMKTSLPTLIGKGGHRNSKSRGANSSQAYNSEAHASSPTRAKTPGGTSKAGSMPSTSDILFLKRLLFLKASIDNEQTVNTFSVPFAQEQARDMAPAELVGVNLKAAEMTVN